MEDLQKHGHGITVRGNNVRLTKIQELSGCFDNGLHMYTINDIKMPDMINTRMRLSRNKYSSTECSLSELTAYQDKYPDSLTEIRDDTYQMKLSDYKSIKRVSYNKFNKSRNQKNKIAMLLNVMKGLK